MAATFSAVCKHLLYTTLHAVKNWTIVQEHTPSHTRHSSPLIGRCIVTLWALPRQTGPQSLNLSLSQHNWGMKQFEVSSCDSRSINLGQLPCSPVQAPFIVWSVLVVSAAFNPKRSHHHKWISTLITTYVRCARLCSISMHKAQQLQWFSLAENTETLLLCQNCRMYRNAVTSSKCRSVLSFAN